MVVGAEFEQRPKIVYGVTALDPSHLKATIG